MLETYPSREARAITDRLLEDVAGLRATDIITDPGRILGSAMMTRLRKAVGELKQYRPLAYVTGKAHFCGLELHVDERVLIPRPETEELAAWIIATHRGMPGLEILEIGTGSGCVALCLARQLAGSTVAAADNSEAALTVARKNALDLGIDVNFFRLNILDCGSYSRLGKYHLLVSNPPYVRFSEKAKMQKNVLDWEPEEALFVPDEDPLVFYRAILEFARLSLLPGGSIFFEINEKFGPQVSEAARNYGFSTIELKKDLNGKDRMIRIRH